MTELEIEHNISASKSGANRSVYFYEFSGYGHPEIIWKVIS